MAQSSTVGTGPAHWLYRWNRYALAALGVALATVVRLPFEPYLVGRAPYGLYFPVLVAVAWFFGARPTLFAAVLSLAAAWFLVVPAGGGAAQSGYVASLGIYVITAGSLIWLALSAARLRRRADQALQSAQRLAAIVESSDDAIIGKDLEGVIQSWNAGAERTYGYRADEVIGRSIELVIPSERRHEEQQILATLRRGERIDHFETERVTKDGTRIDVSISVSPIRGRDGAIVGASKIARDISERKRSERLLAQQREWFRVTLASIGDAVVTSDRDGKVTYLNPVAERLTGWREADARARPLSEVFRIVNEKTREPVENPCDKVLRSGRVIGLANHTVLIASDGSERPIEDSAAPIVDADEKIIGVVLVFHDVSERRRAEDAIAEQREWLETTLMSIGDAVIATDIHCNVTFMNSVAEHVTGWSSAEARGRSCSEIFDIVNETTRAKVESPVARVLREGTVVGLANHTVLIARDGSERPIDDSAAPIRARDGRIVGAVLVFHDVSERRSAEQQRLSAAREREELLQSERAARSEAERANRLKDDFVAIVSHELRTPLNAILGWTQILRRDLRDGPTLERGLGVIERNTRLQAQLISDLLDISSIVSGKLRLELQLVDLAAIASHAVETVKPSADAKNIGIELEVAPQLEPIAGDPARLQQVVWNLLANAVKFSPAGSTVQLKVERDGANVRLTVRDAGIGIRADFLPFIFERFRQADASTTRRFAGLGLGLSIVKRLVEMHGGSVSAHSEGEGRGATFTVSLPLDSARESVAGSLRAAFEGNGHGLAGVSVMVVEDEPDARELVSRLLTEAGCRVIDVDSAEAALAALTRDPPDLLISDIGLPDEDGYSLIQRIRRSDRAEAASLPAIALTAFARSEDRTRALRAGFQAHLAKPVDPAELLAVVASFAQLVDRGAP